MESVFVQFIRQHRALLAALAGLTLAAAFLEWGVAGFAWLAPALLLVALHGTSGRTAFRLGYVFGLAFWLASAHWLLFIPVRGYPVLGWVALSAYLALYPAAWAWLVTPAPGRDAFPIASGLPAGAPLMSAWPSGTGGWGRRATWALTAAAAWVALEMIQARLLGGFPWNLLGVSQYRLTPLIQIASFTGVYGVSFLVAWTAAGLYLAALAIWRQPTARQVWLPDILPPLMALLAAFAAGWRGLAEREPPLATVRVTFIQPSIPQTMIWDETENDRRFAELLALTQQALSNRTDLLLWPEAAVPRMLRYDEATYRAVTDLARTNRIWILLGSDDAEPRGGSQTPDAADYFNSSFLVSPDGALVGRYHKRHLVMFGEYVPWTRWLPFIRWFTPITGGFTPGDAVVTFAIQLTGEPGAPEPSNGAAAPVEIRVAPLICFEDVFPHRVREHARSDTDVLVNLTNDGWFGESAAQWQHAASALFRAVENGLPLLRCCNNGLSCWIDACGRMRAVLRDAHGRIYGPATMTVEVPLVERNGTRSRTFYNRHGDWFGWSCVALTGLRLLPRLSRRAQRGSP